MLITRPSRVLGSAMAAALAHFTCHFVPTIYITTATKIDQPANTYAY
jgi:hypothetical protein